MLGPEVTDVTNELDLIPLLCRLALEEKLSPGRMRRRVERARSALASRRAEVEALGIDWSRQTLTRGEHSILRDAVAEGRREVDQLEKCLAHLHRWAAGGTPDNLQRALGAYDASQRCWKRHLRGVMELAPMMSCREYRA